MNDLTKILLTVILGFSTFVLGQVFIAFFLEPYRKYKELVGVIDHGLVYHANLIHNDSLNNLQQLAEVRRIFRDFGGKFSSIYNALTFRDWLITAKLVPNSADATLVRRKLIYISNAAGDLGRQNALEYLLKAEEEVRRLLNIPDAQ